MVQLCGSLRWLLASGSLFFWKVNKKKILTIINIKSRKTPGTLELAFALQERLMVLVCYARHPVSVRLDREFDTLLINIILYIFAILLVF